MILVPGLATPMPVCLQTGVMPQDGVFLWRDGDGISCSGTLAWTRGFYRNPFQARSAFCNHPCLSILGCSIPSRASSHARFSLCEVPQNGISLLLSAASHRGHVPHVTHTNSTYVSFLFPKKNKSPLFFSLHSSICVMSQLSGKHHFQLPALQVG